MQTSIYIKRHICPSVCALALCKRSEQNFKPTAGVRILGPSGPEILVYNKIRSHEIKGASAFMKMKEGFLQVDTNKSLKKKRM